MKAYKAFDADMKCRGFEYKVGETYEHDGPVALCEEGFHACTVPFDCWDYYPHSMTFARVDIDVADKCEDDSKVVGAKITIEAALTLPEWIAEHVQTVVALCDKAKGLLASDEDECAAATGNYGHAAATGNYGHAAATGYRGHAAATGDSGHAAATGYRGHAAATGDRGHAAATGDSGHAAATGNYGHAAATGDSGHAAVKGESAIAFSGGVNATASASKGSWLVLAAYDAEWNLVCVKSAKAGEDIDADTPYRLTVEGEFVRVEE